MPPDKPPSLTMTRSSGTICFWYNATMTPNDPPDFKVTVLRSDETTIELALEGALYEGTLGLFDEALERHAVASRSRLCSNRMVRAGIG